MKEIQKFYYDICLVLNDFRFEKRIKGKCLIIIEQTLKKGLSNVFG